VGREQRRGRCFFQRTAAEQGADADPRWATTSRVDGWSDTRAVCLSPFHAAPTCVVFACLSPLVVSPLVPMAEGKFSRIPRTSCGRSRRCPSRWRWRRRRSSSAGAPSHARRAAAGTWHGRALWHTPVLPLPRGRPEHISTPPSHDAASPAEGSLTANSPSSVHGAKSPQRPPNPHPGPFATAPRRPQCGRRRLSRGRPLAKCHAH